MKKKGILTFTHNLSSTFSNNKLDNLIFVDVTPSVVGSRCRQIKN